MFSPLVSVVVPCFNAGRHLRQCLEGLTRQQYRACEIVVADDGSTDDTLEIVKEFPGIKVVQSDVNRGPAAARNMGIEASGGDILIFLDSDCVVDDPRWVARHVQGQGELDHTILGGGVVGIGSGVVARADAYCHWLTNVPHSGPRTICAQSRGAWLMFSRHLVTTNMSITRKVLDALGRFDETLRTGEDVEFCERALARGVSLRLEPTLIVRHCDRETLPDFFRCFYRAGRDRVPARSRHHSPYHRLMPRGWLSSVLLSVPIGLLGPLQPIRAWWPYDRRVLLYYPLMALASFAMALGILRYWKEQRTTRR